MTSSHIMSDDRFPPRNRIRMKSLGGAIYNALFDSPHGQGHQYPIIRVPCSVRIGFPMGWDGLVGFSQGHQGNGNGNITQTPSLGHNARLTIHICTQPHG